MSKSNPAEAIWLVVKGGKVLYRTNNCTRAVRFMHKHKLPPNALFTSSYVAGVLLDMMRK